MSAAHRGRTISPTVHVVTRGDAALTACTACGAELGPAAESWKDHAIRRETPLAAAGGPAWDTGDGAVLLRHFYCPSCAALLDTETAMAGDPPLIDRLARG
jgi:acetone carboxylase gamma subunit